MKYSFSLLLLGSSLVAGALLPGAGQRAQGKAGKAAKAGKGAAARLGAGNNRANGQNNNNNNNNGQASNGNNNNNSNGNNNNNNNNNAGTPTASAPGNAVSAANVAPGQNPFLALAPNPPNFPQLTDAQKQGLQQAAVLWSQDTAVVSSALSLLASGQMSDQDFRDTADLAYMAEVNELQQKSYIDALIGQMPQLQAASTSLTNGSFAIVVDQLREMRIRGASNTTFVNAAVQGMNNLRCRQVLLAIDTYVLTANQAAGNNTFISATRPPACQDVYAQTADVIPAGAVVNATTFPNAQQLITQFNQPPRFMVSNAISFSNNPGSDNTPALGSQFSTNAPFSNTSSLAGQLLAFNGQPVQTNGDPNNNRANPLNAVLFNNNGNNNNGQNNNNQNNNGQNNNGQNNNGQNNNNNGNNNNANGQNNNGQNNNNNNN